MPNYLDWVDPIWYPELARLGRNPRWISFFVNERSDGQASTGLKVNAEHLPQETGPVVKAIHNRLSNGDWAALGVIDALSALLTDGPKYYAPTEEQFEAMEQVELNLPISDYRQPYPALVVTIPLGCRASLARQFGLNVSDVALDVLIRFRSVVGEAPLVIGHMGQFGRNTEVFYLFQHQPKNPTIETALARDAGTSQDNDQKTDRGLFEFGKVVTRAAMNLCLMMCHFGCHLAPQPKKNRAQRRAQTLHGDFRAILMKQDLVVRAKPVGSALNQPGLGTGPEVRPHWRKGHWRAYPGCGPKRASGVQVPLLFVRPCLVRSDRVVGDISESTVTYRG